MQSFLEYLEEDLVTFGGKAYPKYGQFVILAGGSGSGKGFIIKSLLGIDAKVIDPDYLKELVLKSHGLVNSKLKQITGKQSFDLKKPEDVRDVHVAIDSNLNLNNKRTDTLSTQQRKQATLPNLIFDTTLRDFSKFSGLVETAIKMGYLPENIHLVWVINDVEVAREQNKKRSRTVPDDILLGSHAGASANLKRIVADFEHSGIKMNGDLWFVFNREGTDTTVAKSNTGKSVLTKGTYFKVKSSGSRQIRSVPDQYLNKIRAYTPNPEVW